MSGGRYRHCPDIISVRHHYRASIKFGMFRRISSIYRVADRLTGKRTFKSKLYPIRLFL